MATKEEEIKELLLQAEKLNEKKETEKVIELLTDVVLDKYKRAELYTERARAHSILNEHDLQLLYVEKAFAQNSNYFKLYYSKGNYWRDKKEYDKAIEDYSKAISLQPDYADAYVNRGTVWNYKKEYDKAIEDYSKAISLQPDYAAAYNNRGTAWNAKKEYDKAIEDFSKVISLQPDDADAYNNSGVAFYFKKNFDKSIENYKRAIEEYSKESNLNPNKAVSLQNLGNVYKDLQDFDTAISYYEQAIAANKDYSWLQNTIDELKAKTKKIDEVVVTSDSKADKSLYFLVGTIDNLDISDTNKRLMKDIGYTFLEAMNAIRDYSFADNNNPVVHYTKLKVADILVSAEDEPKLRYYNVVYMNDPEEGETLFDCLGDENIRDSFNSGMEVQENNIYLGSFLPAEQGSIKNNHEDELVMWRTYGKDEFKNEASGCSIIINPDFFDKEKQYLHSDMNRSIDGTADIKATQNTQSLYSVLYYDKRDQKLLDPKDKDLNALINDLKSAIKTFIGLKDSLPKSPDISKAIDKIVYRFLSEVRYLFKSADYAFENELRVIQYASPRKDTATNLVKIDDNGNQWLPRRLYIESNKPVREYVGRIYLGPKVQNPQTWMYLEAAMKLKGFTMELKESVCKFV